MYERAKPAAIDPLIAVLRHESSATGNAPLRAMLFEHIKSLSELHRYFAGLVTIYELEVEQQHSWQLIQRDQLIERTSLPRARQHLQAYCERFGTDFCNVMFAWYADRGRFATLLQQPQVLHEVSVRRCATASRVGPFALSL